ncbi:G1 family glutamic endopeptidase [Kitasatospora sp. NPDC058965]|uniref:G1 family glutamic endopeptidase n=1 Tax=Kitasatospora sp. NPDC058965 TaxID=3346682 RepID=UPI0036A6714C
MIRRHLTLATALAAVLAGAAPAVAAPAPVHAPLIRTSPHPDETGLTHGTSSNWSGYAATGHQFTSVSASWIQPTAHCTAQDTWSSFWVGLDGDGSNSVEQTGSEVDCSSGRPQYYSWYEMYPAYPVNYNDPVDAGDHFTASVTAGTRGSFTLVLSDTTKGWSHTVHRTLRNARLASAEVVAEAPSTLAGPLPLTDFGTVGFTAATADGHPLGSFAPEQITMARGGTTLVTVSPLTGGTDFTAAWQHS